jgi:hypothetical protein
MGADKGLESHGREAMAAGQVPAAHGLRGHGGRSGTWKPWPRGHGRRQGTWQP